METDTTVTRDLLSLHETVAKFTCFQERPCFHRTSLCPDRCNHGGTVAIFAICKYLNYEKPGKYGDAKTDKFYVRPQDIPPGDIKETLDKLQPGDYVLLSWNHDYVHKGGSSFPERPITKLVKITEEEADVKE